MLFNRHRNDSASALTVVRDLVEIFAILAAGVWAFYIFVYENRWLPAQQQPRLDFTATMQRLSRHDGLRAVRAEVRVRNVGTVKVQFLAFSITIVGSKVTVSREIRTARTQGALNTLEAYYAISGATPVYRTSYLTHAANPAYSADLFLEPGEESDREVVTYAPVGKFDRLTLTISALYTKDSGLPIATSVTYGEDGVPAFTPVSSAAAVIQVQAPFAALDLQD
jgi:hypothetical protein